MANLKTMKELLLASQKANNEALRAFQELTGETVKTKVQSFRSPSQEKFVGQEEGTQARLKLRELLKENNYAKVASISGYSKGTVEGVLRNPEKRVKRDFYEKVMGA